MESRNTTSKKRSEDVNQEVLAAYSEKFQELTRWDTYMECILGCGTGGAIYWLLVISGLLFFQSTFVAILLMWPFLIVFGFLAGAISGTLVSLIVLPINASLGWPLKSLWFGFVVGGLSGFFPFFVILLGPHSPKDAELMFLAAVGPLPQMVLGHLWAYWLTEKAVNDRNERFGVVKHQIAQADIRASRFGITHIMILTVWAALGFSMLSFFTPEFRMLLAKFYLPVQVAAGLVSIIVITLVSYVRRYRKRKGLTANH